MFRLSDSEEECNSSHHSAAKFVASAASERDSEKAYGGGPATETNVASPPSTIIATTSTTPAAINQPVGGNSSNIASHVNMSIVERLDSKNNVKRNGPAVPRGSVANSGGTLALVESMRERYVQDWETFKFFGSGVRSQATSSGKDDPLWSEVKSAGRQCIQDLCDFAAELSRLYGEELDRFDIVVGELESQHQADQSAVVFLESKMAHMKRSAKDEVEQCYAQLEALEVTNKEQSTRIDELESELANALNPKHVNTKNGPSWAEVDELYREKDALKARIESLLQNQKVEGRRSRRTSETMSSAQHTSESSSELEVESVDSSSSNDIGDKKVSARVLDEMERRLTEMTEKGHDQQRCISDLEEMLEIANREVGNLKSEKQKLEADLDRVEMENTGILLEQSRLREDLKDAVAGLEKAEQELLTAKSHLEASQNTQPTGWGEMVAEIRGLGIAFGQLKQSTENHLKEIMQTQQQPPPPQEGAGVSLHFHAHMHQHSNVNNISVTPQRFSAGKTCSESVLGSGAGLSTPSTAASISRKTNFDNDTAITLTVVGAPETATACN